MNSPKGKHMTAEEKEKNRLQLIQSKRMPRDIPASCFGPGETRYTDKMPIHCCFRPLSAGEIAIRKGGLVDIQEEPILGPLWRLYVGQPPGWSIMDCEHPGAEYQDLARINLVVQRGDTLCLVLASTTKKRIGNWIESQPVWALGL